MTQFRAADLTGPMAQYAATLLMRAKSDAYFPRRSDIQPVVLIDSSHDVYTFGERGLGEGPQWPEGLLVAFWTTYIDMMATMREYDANRDRLRAEEQALWNVIPYNVPDPRIAAAKTFGDQITKLERAWAASSTAHVKAARAINAWVLSLPRENR